MLIASLSTHSVKNLSPFFTDARESVAKVLRKLPICSVPHMVLSGMLSVVWLQALHIIRRRALANGLSLLLTQTSCNSQGEFSDI